MLEIKNLHVADRRQENSQRPEPQGRRGRSRRSWGRTAPANRRCPMSSPAAPIMKSPTGDAARRRRSARIDAGRARRARHVPGLPVSARNSRRRHHDLPQGRAQRAAQGARRSRNVDARLHEARARGGGDSSTSPRTCSSAPVNVGFSGGEKKRMEILQMALLEPRFAILDEMDSGLDIDALRICAEGVNALRSPERGLLVITHYQRLLDYIVPDVVHVMAQGRIVRSGGTELALELEETGYRRLCRSGSARRRWTRSLTAKTAAEAALAEPLRRAARALPGSAAVDVCATPPSSVSRGRPAQPPRRSLALYRSARPRCARRRRSRRRPTRPAIAMPRAERSSAACAPRRTRSRRRGFRAELSDARCPRASRVRRSRPCSPRPIALIEALARMDATADDPLVRSQRRLMRGRLVIEVAPGAQMAEPIEIIVLCAAHRRPQRAFRASSSVSARARRRASLEDRGGGRRRLWRQRLVPRRSATSAELDHALLRRATRRQRAARNRSSSRSARSAKFDSFALVADAPFLRRQIFVRFAGARAQSRLCAARRCCAAANHADTTLIVDA